MNPVAQIVTDAATTLMLRALCQQFPSPQLSEIVVINNGQGLKAEKRDSAGNFEVYGSGGLVANHSEGMHEGPFVVIGRKGSAGKVTFAPRGGWVTDTAYFATPLRPRELQCKFLFYGLKALDFSADIITTAIPGINRTAIYGHSIPLPPLELQKSVVEFLDALANGKSGKALPVLPPPLAEQRRIVAQIEELAAKIDDARTLRGQAAEETEAFVISNHIQLSGGRTRRLGEILKLDEVAVPVRPDGSYPQVGVKSFGRGLFAKSAISGTETTYRAFNRLFEGALVLSQVKGWEGAVAVCPKELVGWLVSPEYRTFRCIEGEARPGYLSSIVRTEWFWGRLTDATRGVGARRERTRPEQFLNIEVPMPDWQGQDFGERVFGEVDALKRLQAETAAELDAMLQAILGRAFKGEL